MDAALCQCEVAIQAQLASVRTSDVRAQEVITTLEAALADVSTGLRATHSGAQKDVAVLRSHLEVFSITLFGRTMAGKSTLMEILTRGHGRSIGQGAQRTTRDVRHYRWEALQVTDVPGIAAVDGTEDERLAHDAAARADLVVFLITDDAPQPEEAKHLVHVRRLGKTMLGLCNVKIGIDDQRGRRRFLRDPDRPFDPHRLDALTAQFLELARRDAPDLHIPFLPTHLRARFLADQPEGADDRDALLAASRFQAVDDTIRNEVIQHGPFRRTQTFLSAVANPLLDLVEVLWRIRDENARFARFYEDKRQELDRWKEKFVVRAHAKIPANIKHHVDELRHQLPGFVECWVGKKTIKETTVNEAGKKTIKETTVNEAWRAMLDGAKLGEKADHILRSLHSEATEHLQGLLKELAGQHAFVASLGPRRDIQSSSITDYRRIAGWTNATVGAGAAVIAFLAVSNPIGWAVVGVGIAVGILTWLLPKRDKKMQKARAALSKQLNDHLDTIERDLTEQVLSTFEEHLHDGLLKQAGDDLSLFIKTLRDQSDVLTHLAENLTARLQRLHADLLEAACAHLQLDALVIRNSARLPGVRSVLVVDGRSLRRAHADLPRLEALLGERIHITSQQHEIELVAEVLGCGLTGRDLSRDTMGDLTLTTSPTSPPTPDDLRLVRLLTGRAVHLNPQPYGPS